MGFYTERTGRSGGGGGGGILGGGSGGSEVDAILASQGILPTAPTVDPEEGTPRGIFDKIKAPLGNAVGDVGEFTEGMLGIGGAVLHDLGQATPWGPDDPTGYRTDELAKGLVFDPKVAKEKGIVAAISPIMQEYAESQYGINPLKGDLKPEADKLGHALYHDPLNTFLDALGVTSFAGRKVGNAALRSAKRSLKSGAKADELSPLVQKILPGLDPEGRLRDPDLEKRIANEEFDEIRYGGVRPRLLEVGEPRIDPKSLRGLPINPIRRGLGSGVRRLTTRDRAELLDDIKGVWDDIDEELKQVNEGDPDAFMAAHNLNAEEFEKARLYQAAREFDIERIEKPFVAERRVEREVRKLASRFGSRTYGLGSQDVEQLAQVFRRANLSPEEYRAAWKTFEGRVRGNTTRLGGRKMSLEDSLTWLQGARAAEVFGDKLGGVQKVFDDIADYLTETEARFDQLVDELENLEPDKKMRQQELVQELAYLPDEIDAAERYARQLSEYLVTRDVGGGRMAKLVADLRWQRHEMVMHGIRNPWTPNFTFLDVMRSTYGPLHIEPITGSIRMGAGKFAKRQAHGGLSKDDLRAFDAAKIFEEDSHFWKDLDDSFDEFVAPVYYPQMDPRRFRPSETMARKSGAMMRQLPGAFNYRSYYNFVNGNYLRSDPLEAYARRARHMRTIYETQRFVEEMVKLTGRRIRTADEVTPFERLFNPRGHRVFYRNRALMDEAISEAAKTARSADEAIQAGVKDAEIVLADLVKAEDLGNYEVYAVPKAVAKALDAYSRGHIGFPGQQFFDNFTEMWRGAVLAWMPRWISNNLMGSTLFLKMQGGLFTDVLRQLASPAYRKAVKAVIDELPEDARAAIDATFTSAEATVRNLGGGARTPTGAFRLRTQTEPGAFRAFFRNQTQRNLRVNQALEDVFRRASYMSAIERQAVERGARMGIARLWRSQESLADIARLGADEKSVLAAIDEMNYFMNDYRQMGGLERNVVRRFFFPFWSFYKHTAKLTLGFPVTHPERAFVIRMLGEMAKDFDDELGPLPGYLTGALPIGSGPDGKTKFLNPRAAIPLGQFAETLEDRTLFGGMLGPVPKAIMEQFTGRDAFTGRPFDSPEAAGAFGYDEQYKGVYDEQGNLIGVEPEPTEVRPGFLEILANQFPQAELARDLLSLGPWDETPGVVGTRYSTGEERLENGQVASPRDPLSLILGTLGIPTTDLDVGKYQEIQLAGQKAGVTTLLRRMGRIPWPEEE